MDTICNSKYKTKNLKLTSKYGPVYLATNYFTITKISVYEMPNKDIYLYHPMGIVNTKGVCLYVTLLEPPLDPETVWNGHFCPIKKKVFRMVENKDICFIFHRPRVAGAVRQTPS